MNDDLLKLQVWMQKCGARRLSRDSFRVMVQVSVSIIIIIILLFLLKI